MEFTSHTTQPIIGPHVVIHLFESLARLLQVIVQR